MKKKWYYQTWLICLLVAFWPLTIPPIIGFVLLWKSSQEDKKIADAIKAQEAALDKRLEDVESEEQNARLKIDELTQNRSELLRELDVLRREILVEYVNIDAYKSLKSDEVKNSLQVLKMKQTDAVKSGKAFNVTLSTLPKKHVDYCKKQIMRCYNAESTNIIESVTVKNIDTCRSKLQRSFEALNKLFEWCGGSISMSYHQSKLEELSLVYAYMVKIDEEKELQREIREQLKEEEKVRREIEQAKLKIEKEEAQFNGEINKLMGYMQKASEVEKQLYVDKIRELEEKLKLLEKDKENVLEREQNTRAGFVYIISNIGSFGEDVFKIGMTRRLEPMDRIKELGSASVPFNFDVHAIIFSEDAPGLETVLHQTFKAHQVNKVNPRKEFFNIDLKQIEAIVKENHSAVVQFVEVPEAFDYRESMRIANELKV